jgi:6-phosphofructokinase 1
MTRCLGILTGGGDSPSLNAVIRAVTTRATLGHGWTVVGIEHGFRGLVEGLTQRLDLTRVRELLPRGGTILGASNRSNPFQYPVKSAGRVQAQDLSQRALANLAALGLDDVIAVGGDGTMEIARRLVERGARIVGVPKTIDNDLAATDTTCGYQTAVAVVTEALDRLRTTAESHDRIMLCEVMGRYAGWIALEGGIAGGADAILIPEIPYQIERVVELCAGRPSTLVVVAEGARPAGGQRAVVRAADATRPEKLGGAAERLAVELGALLPEHDARVTVLGHVQRGGTPVAVDRVLATRFGVAAVDLVAAGETGVVVVQRGRGLAAVPMSEVCQGAKLVDPAGELVRTARALGVVLGD